MEDCPCKRKKLDDDTENSRTMSSNGEEQEIKAGSQDKEYFQSYADVGIHEEMLNDVVRTNAYRYAILKNYEKIRGKVVADVGAGTGILSVFCVQAGAKKVYAIEGSALAKQTRLVVEENKMADRITVLQGRAEDVKLPEKVDVIVSEWMGYALFYESMLPSVLHIRDRWMKKVRLKDRKKSDTVESLEFMVAQFSWYSLVATNPCPRQKKLGGDGVILPSSASLYIAPFSDDEISERLETWSAMKEKYKVSMECMKTYAKQCLSYGAHVRCICPEDVIAHACQLVNFDLSKVTVQEVTDIQRNFELTCFGSSVLHGFVLWFTVSFPENVILSTSPYSQSTHWGQTLLYNEEECDVRQDTQIHGTITMKPNKAKPRFLDVNIGFQIDKHNIQQKSYYMSDNIT